MNQLLFEYLENNGSIENRFNDWRQIHSFPCCFERSSTNLKLSRYWIGIIDFCSFTTHNSFIFKNFKISVLSTKYNLFPNAFIYFHINDMVIDSEVECYFRQ